MQIGLDAKRAFHNTTGLGNYSRNLIIGLATYFPKHNYILYNVKKSNLFNEYQQFPSIKEVLPQSLFYKKIHPLWRSVGIKDTFDKEPIQLYHGLSNELPLRLQSNIATVVTIHDLIFERYPEQYTKIDVWTYRKKYQYACTRANLILANSAQTKSDLIDIYGIDKHKIVTCYQSYPQHFLSIASSEQKQQIQKKYHLPQSFFLSVGNIVQRKNLLTICKAIQIILKQNKDIYLVIVGSGKGIYYEKVKKFVADQKLHNNIIFLNETDVAKKISYNEFNADLPTIYQQAKALIYPSVFEGWGIPVMEGFLSKIPVITTHLSSLKEVGGDAAFYVSPFDELAMAEKMMQILEDESLRNHHIQKGLLHAMKFALQPTTERVMNAYKILCP